MSILLPALAVAFAAFCVWLMVRIVNRRERWAIRVAVTSVAVLAYPLSVVPACWLVDHGILKPNIAGALYDPLFWLEFHAPRFIQDAVSRCTKNIGTEAAYIRLRDAPFPRSYPVDDLAFRWKAGRRVHSNSPFLLNWIESTSDAYSWEAFSGRGSLQIGPDRRSVIVSQSRRVHVEVATNLEKIRFLKESLAPGRDIDIQALERLIDGIHSASDLKPGVVCITNPTDDRLVIGEFSFADIDELIAFLRKVPRDSLRSGIYWNQSWREPPPEELERLKDHCQSRDLDLFIARYSGGPFQGYRVNMWVTRSSDSIYLDPE